MGKWIAAAIILVVAAGAGFLAGRNAAPGTQEFNEARAVAQASAFDRWLAQSDAKSFPRGLKAGVAAGTMAATDSAWKLGSAAGSEASDEAIAAAEAEAAAAAEEAENQLEYSDELPNGNPGYLLPEDERTFGCVGYDAQTGQCVGD